MTKLTLIVLILLGVSCSKGTSFKNTPAPSTPVGPIAEVALPEESQVELDLEVVGEDQGSDESSGVGDEVADVDEELRPLERCEVISENERQEVGIEFLTSSVKLTSLQSSKLKVEGFTFSPSNNSKAAVLHDDKDFQYEGKKVLKITGRVVFDRDSKTGELQVSFRLKEAQGASQTEFMALGDVVNCR
jgi:hypothetical protein